MNKCQEDEVEDNEGEEETYINSPEQLHFKVLAIISTLLRQNLEFINMDISGVFELTWTCMQHSKSGEALYNDSIVFI